MERRARGRYRDLVGVHDRRAFRCAEVLVLLSIVHESVWELAEQ